eukprot:CAMPEP_0196581376 /NCGR_PEP_ID=MMETSP1081-20130531/33904_1 /TAXON_ID=36882 /ORGANISM="Pyramimonas amylifera, Strain CCMP720" /LENGTH=117 /DNA_ID=CAMNT_0041901587 /DNA_START=96 /DNA_END=446 /DNA_ORIENTATION=-
MVDMRRVRNNHVVKTLRKTLGDEGLKEFKEMSWSYQHGKMDVHDYYHSALCKLQDNAPLLLQVVSLLPQRVCREGLEKYHYSRVGTDSLSSKHGGCGGNGGNVGMGESGGNAEVEVE